MASPPFPPSGSYIASVRSSSAALRTKSNIIIDPAAIHTLLRSKAFTDSFQRVSKQHGLALPLKFPSYLAELNCISILSLLNFASGYRVPLHRETKRGAWDNIRALILSMYITSSAEDYDYMSAAGMQSMDAATIAGFMGVTIHVEKPHMPGISEVKLGGPLYNLVKLIETTLNETGRILVEGRYPNLGAFVAEALEAGAKVKSPHGNAAADVILERLVKAFPAFQDMALINGQPVYCFKKALFLIAAVSFKFSHLEPQPFFIPDIDDLPVFSDNVLPSLLIHLGVIDVRSCEALQESLASMFDEARLASLFDSAPLLPSKEDGAKASPPKEGPLLRADQTYLIRAAAIEACELIVAEAASMGLAQELGWNEPITLPLVDCWLWSVAKDRADYRALARVAERDTVFY